MLLTLFILGINIRLGWSGLKQSVETDTSILFSPQCDFSKPHRAFVLAKCLIDRWVGGLLLLSGMHQNGLENGKQMQSCMHFWLSLKVVWLSLANLTTCDWIIRDLILHVNRTRHDPFFYFYFFILCVMIDCAALPKPVNMLNESQIIVWPTHILFNFCLHVFGLLENS